MVHADCLCGHVVRATSLLAALKGLGEHLLFTLAIGEGDDVDPALAERLRSALEMAGKRGR